MSTPTPIPSHDGTPEPPTIFTMGTPSASLDSRFTPLDAHFMRLALHEATTALETLEVPVGAVFVHFPPQSSHNTPIPTSSPLDPSPIPPPPEYTLLATGRNDTNRTLCGTRHAEFLAIESILTIHPPSIFAESTLYVTVEPCVMCASALRQLGLRRVVYGCMNERFGGCGGAITVGGTEGKVEGDCKEMQVIGGLYREEAIMLLRRFYVQENGRAPRPIEKRKRELKVEIAPGKEGAVEFR